MNIRHFDAKTNRHFVVYDAEGRKVPYAVSGDTVTGLVTCMDLDADGKPVTTDDGAVKCSTRRYPAPLRLVLGTYDAAPDVLGGTR